MTASVATLTSPRRVLPPDGLDLLDLCVHLSHIGPLPPTVPANLLDEVERSGLLGRGGAGFPLARKLRAAASGRRRAVVVANGCEGEPASRKDRFLLTHAPHLVLDGLQAAAAAVGARDAHLVLHEGSPARPAVAQALAGRRAYLVDRVRVHVHELPARYVASEATAIVHYLSGGPALPTLTPPHLAQRGLGRRPTVVSNVETLAHLALVARYGSDWFRSVGHPDCPGSTLLTVAGPGTGPRVLEVETGTAIGDVFATAGVDLADAQAVLTGGYAGAWLPVEAVTDLPLTHTALRAAGGALGAGVLLALPADRCGLAETSRVTTYLAGQSARQCGPCLNGLPAIADALRRLAFGPWDERLAAPLARWLDVVPGRGACAHPDGAVRLVASALRVFAADGARHRVGLPCPAVGPGWLPVPDLP